MGIILACFLMIIIPYAASISFNLTNISRNSEHEFRFEGGAYISDDGIQNNTSVNPDQSSTKYERFVWVEFDPYCNAWERNPSTCDHVGINVNSDASIANKPSLIGMSSEREHQVWIEYDSVSQNLSVSFTGFRNNIIFQDGLNHKVDLRGELPEWVFIGFSAAIGEVNTVKSWVFNSSNLQDDENNIGLVVGLVAGISVLITLFVTIAFILRRKKKEDGDKVEELEISVDMNHGFEMGATGPRRFSYLELARATVGFAENEKLGEGSFGGVYKGLVISA
ncbi:hypothetical protein L1987_55320 [Smallanthus sonchifolius]|uniref:Uncharacterized protein n=1 Tax=Smallanthus sonchifolius TaxID=185202 RepID=A0ACB9EAA8_9ASTR|nr:hypothetical protein L1987_55320 [Smallanthus sonchifolius]